MKQPTYKTDNPRLQCAICREQNVTVQFRDTETGKLYLDMHHQKFHSGERP